MQKFETLEFEPTLEAVAGYAGGLAVEFAFRELTPREIEILQLTAEGHSITEIARGLFIGESTAKSYRKHIYAKIGVSNAAAAVDQGIKSGIIEYKNLTRNPSDELSGREQEILSLIAEGYTNVGIAEKLATITKETTKSHLKHILDKLKAENRAHAVLRGYELGYLDMPAGGEVIELPLAIKL